MKTKYPLIALILVLSTSCVQAVTAQARQKRKGAAYDEGGSFDFNWELTPQTRERMKAELREFVWLHWSQRRLGRVLARFYTCEGDHTTYRLYVESDSNGRWHVVSEYESECCALYASQMKKKKRSREKGVDVYDLVERVEEQPSGIVRWKVIEEVGDRKSNTYFLRLSNIESKKSKDPFIL